MVQCLQVIEINGHDTESSTLHLVVHFFAITVNALTQLAVFTRGR